MAETIHFELVSPSRLVFSEPVEMAVVPGVDGDFGAMAMHAPMLSTVRPGTVTLYDKGQPKTRLFVNGGFAEVTNHRCTVLAEEALDLAHITEADVAARLQQADDVLKEARDDAERRKAEQAKRTAEALKAAFEGAGGPVGARHS